MKKSNKLNKTFLQNNKSYKSASGITLIALIITIIVLLILAGVALSSITGNDSALDKAKEARIENDKGAMKDAATLKATNLIQEYMNKKYVSHQSLGTGVVTAGDYVANQIVGTEGGYTYAVSSKELTITDTKGNTVTGTILDNGNINWGTTTPTEPEEPQTPVEPLEIGDTVNYSTTLNEVTLDNWKVFYVEGDYTYLIYGNDLATSAINTEHMEGISTDDTSMYSIYPNGDIDEFHNALKANSNWNSLLTGTLNGKNINYSDTTDKNIYAMGTPTLNLWVDSWNAVYPSERLYVEYNIEDEQYLSYKIGTSSNPDSDHIQLTNSSTLFFVDADDSDSCYGYHVNSECITWNGWFTVDCEGAVSKYIGTNYYDSNPDWYSIRPVIKLPSSVVNQ